MDVKTKFVHIFAILVVKVVIPTDCFHLIPTSSPCCDSLPPPPAAGGGAIPDPQTSHPFRLNLETVPFSGDDDTSAGYRSRAYGCSLLPCLLEETEKAVCACNYNTGNVVTFKNTCDVKKHNCRFDTAFKVILNEVCPWEFESRRANKQLAVDYSDPKYYNK